MNDVVDDQEWKCPLDQQYGDIVCRDGVLMALVYSEMAPPDSRMAIDTCYYCEKHKRELFKTQQRGVKA